MNRMFNSAKPPRYRSPPHDADATPAASQTAASNAEAIHEARKAQDTSDELRRNRIAFIAYLMAEARDFEPGHAEEDNWRRAEAQVAAEDAEQSQA